MYKSPLHILADLDADLSALSDPGFLLRLRKKLLAEFNLSDSATIDINGKAYSKDEVIKTIDVLMGNPQMPLHSFIFANKPLLDFLENDQSNVRPFDIKNIAVPEELKPMLSPLLLERIVFTVKKAFYARDFDRVTDIVTYSPELTEEDKAVFYEELNKNLVNLQEHIHSVRSAGFAHITSELSYLNKNSLAVLLNYLPSDFIDTINSLVGEIINTMVIYQQTFKKHDRKFLYYISVMLCKVQCDEELMKLIRSNHAAFTQNYNQRSGGSTESSGDFFSGRTISIAIFVIIFLVRVATCSRNTSHDSHSTYSTEKMYSTIREANKANGHSEFLAYRKHINSSKEQSAGNNFPLQYVQEGTIDGGSNPFRYLFQRAGMDLDEDQSMVIINNSTGHDLIIIAYNDENATGAYFYNNKQDTLLFKPTDKLCLYFGDSLVYRQGMDGIASMGVAFEPYREVRFNHHAQNALDIFNKDYVLVLKKRTGKTAIPKVKLAPSFFKDQRYENSTLVLEELSMALKGQDKGADSLTTEAEFPGGEEAMVKFIRQNIRYPFDALKSNIQGRALIYFEITEKGKVSNVWLKQGFFTSCDREALRVIKLMPDWKPATKNGKPVRVSKTIPVKFIQGENAI